LQAESRQTDQRVAGVFAPREIALTAYGKSLAVRERLAEADRSNTMWQLDLAVSHAKLALTYLKLGSLAEALSQLRQGHEIMSALVATAPDNNECLQ
jgi:hypothetical protein